MKKLVFLLTLLLIPSPTLAQTTQTIYYTSLSVTSETLPSVLEPGDSGNLIVTITNTGTLHARNVKLRIIPNQYVTFGKYEFSLQTIDAGDSKQVAIPIKISDNTPYGTLAVFYTISYSEGESSGTKKITGAVSLSIRRRPSLEIIEIEFDRERVIPGSEVTLTLHVKNVGKGRAKDVSLNVDVSNLPFVAIGTTSFFIGDLDQGESKRVSVKLIVNEDAEIKAYSLPVSFTYYDEDGNKKEEKEELGLKVYGAPEFVITVDEVKNLFSGEVGQITFSIANRGIATAKYLTLKIESEVPIMPNEYYIGNIEPDDYETADFNLDLTAIPPGKYEILLSLSYKNPYNEDFNETKMFQITVEKQKVKINYWVLILVLAILLFWKRKGIRKILKK